MIPFPELLGLFVTGVLGSTHCVGMCGPYVALCLAAPGFGGRPRPLAFAGFTLARLAVYSWLGAFAGSVGLALSAKAVLAGAWLSIASGLLVAAIGLSLLSILPDPTRVLGPLGWDRLVSGGMAGARKLAGPGSPLPRPVRKAAIVLVLGGLQGLLPCGLVWAFLARAAATGSPGGGAATMLAFGLGTVPALAGFAFLAGRIPDPARIALWKLAGALVVAGGALLVLRGLAGLGLVPHGGLW